MPLHAETSFAERPIGDIATSLPGATGIFRKYRLDFCCGGDQLLKEAAARRGADLASIESELASLDRGAESDVPEDASAIIDYILHRYHETHRRQLPELLRLALKVESVHADNPQVPKGLAALIRKLIGDLEVHMKKEELILFPLIKSGVRSVDGPIAQMRFDHDDHGVLLRRLEEITNCFTPPEGACRSWQALYSGAAKFMDDIMEHISLENNVLFPQFEEHAPRLTCH